MDLIPPSVLIGMLKKERDRRLAESSLYEFFKQAWPVVEPGTEFTPSWHIKTICEHLEAITRGDIKRLLINIPPRHTKSTLVSVTWPMWEWLKVPEEKYLCASYSGVLSIRDNLKARRLVQSNWYQENWKDRFQLSGDQNSKQRFENDHTGYRIATSVGGSATGEGGTRLICDDPHSAMEAQSDALRETAIDWFDSTWSTRLNNPKTNVMVVIMQRLHEDDVTGHIVDDIKGWEHLLIPAEYDGVRRKTKLGYYDPRKTKGELICPERFGRKEIENLKILLGIYGASAQLQQDPTPPDGGILKTSFFGLWPVERGLPVFEYVLQSYDCAYTEKTTGDPTACSVWGVFTYKGKRHGMLLDAWSEFLAYPAMRKRIVDDWTAEYSEPDKSQLFGKAKRPDRIIVEDKASGISLLQDLRLAKVPAVSYNPGNADKVARAHQASPILETGVLWIPESQKNAGQPVSWAIDFIKQLGKFPRGAHDDYVDTFVQAIIYLKNDRWFDLQTAEDVDEEKPKTKEKCNPYAA
jgi:predicted phage terminase large subunit-like protein